MGNVEAFDECGGLYAEGAAVVAPEFAAGEKDAVVVSRGERMSDGERIRHNEQIAVLLERHRDPVRADLHGRQHVRTHAASQGSTAHRLA